MSGGSWRGPLTVGENPGSPSQLGNCCSETEGLLRMPPVTVCTPMLTTLYKRVHGFVKVCLVRYHLKGHNWLNIIVLVKDVQQHCVYNYKIICCDFTETCSKFRKTVSNYLPRDKASQHLSQLSAQSNGLSPG